MNNNTLEKTYPSGGNHGIFGLLARESLRKARKMLTDSMVDGFVAQAGPTFAWDVKGTSRPAADVRIALRNDLWDRQGRMCPVCGEGDNGVSLEFNHVVARGPKVKGFVAGNVFTGHATCNAATKPQHDATGAVVSGVAVLRPGVHITRPDVIATEWTSFPVLRLRK